MAEISYTYTRVAKDLGKPFDFQLMEPEDIIDIPPNPALKAQYTVADPYETKFLNKPSLSEQQTNTERIILKHQGQQPRRGWMAHWYRSHRI